MITPIPYLRSLIPDLHRLEAQADGKPENIKKKIHAITGPLRKRICDEVDKIKNREITKPEVTIRTIIEAQEQINKVLNPKKYATKSTIRFRNDRED
jgi:hypothetical protein